MNIRFGVGAGFDRLSEVIKAGYDYIEPPLNALCKLNDEELEKTVALVDASPIKAEVFNCFFSRENPIVGDYYDLHSVREYAKKGIARASRLGAKVLVIGSGWARNVPNGYEYGEISEQFSNIVKECAKIAAQQGIVIVVEPLNTRETNLINTVEQGLDFAKKINMPSVKGLADFYHVYQNGESLDAIRTSGELLAHVHIAGPQRTMAEMRDNLPLLNEWRNALLCCRYSGRMSLEGKFAPDFLDDLIKARELLGKIFEK